MSSRDWIRGYNMSKKKGLSVGEKRSRMLDFFFEKKDFFMLKELEKQCQKEKGITSMSVKDILQSLVDDDMVDTEKIGTSVYFWAFPSKASQNRKRKISDLEGKCSDVERKKQATVDNIQRRKVGREDTEERSALLSDLSAASSALEKLCGELQKYRDCDPEVMATMKQDAITAKDAANRWTDNIFAIKSWAKKKFNIEEQLLNKQFGIPEDLDYLD